LIREWFRIDEKTTPPNATEVELCRIKLQPGTIRLEKPTDVLFPEANQLDLRYRTQAKARPQAVVRVAQLTYSDFEDERLLSDEFSDSATPMYWRRTGENLSYLMQSVAALYPALQGATQVEQETLQAKTAAPDYDLLYLTDWQVLNLDEEELDTLSQYLEAGGIILVEAPTDSADLVESLQTLITQQLDTPLKAWEELSRNHPLRTQPFLFAALPIINQQPLQLWHGGGIILIMGELSAAWGLDEELSLPRSDIRTAQELGINILHFAWHRRQLTQLLQ
jgi:hypothetical protein